MLFVKESGNGYILSMYIDSHAHLTCDALYNELEKLLKRAQESKVERIINICTDKSSLERGLKLSRDVNWVYNVGATPPHDVEKEGGLYFHLFERAAKEGELIAIGETGLDYHYEHSPRKTQQIFLSRYFQLAEECQLPVVIHCRDAFDDLFTMASHDFPKGHVLLHCFTGSLKEMTRAIERGWMISLSGILTFKRSSELRDIAKEIPMNHLLIETDAPYLSPETKRGKQNEPSFISETAQVLADLKGIPLQEVAKITKTNAETFFKITP